MPYQNKQRVDPEFAMTLNLNEFAGAQTISVNGQTGLFIPYDSNPCLFVGEKKVSMDINAFKKDQPSEHGDTHYLRPKVRRDIQLTPEQKMQYTPICGNMKPYSAIIAAANRQKGGYQGGYAPQGGFQQGAPSQQQYAPQGGYPQQQGGYASQSQQYPSQQQQGYQGQAGYQRGVPSQQQYAPQGGYRQQQALQGGSAGYGKPAPAAPQGGYAPRVPQVPPTPPVYDGGDMPEGL